MADKYVAIQVGSIAGTADALLESNLCFDAS